MTNANHFESRENLSDLLDDQVSDEAIERLLADEASSSESQSQAWFRYNMVSAVLNKEQSAYASFDFTQTVSAQIANEPAILARPKKTAQIIPLWRKATTGFAIAASVAFAMVFSVQMMNTPMEGLSGGTDVATQATAQDLSPLQMNITPSQFSAEHAEQEQLDDIQRLLEQMSLRNPNVNEQLVGGEFIQQSFVVKTKPQATSFEEKIRSMKKPSEVDSKKK